MYEKEVDDLWDPPDGISLVLSFVFLGDEFVIPLAGTGTGAGGLIFSCEGSEWLVFGLVILSLGLMRRCRWVSFFLMTV